MKTFITSLIVLLLLPSISFAGQKQLTNIDDVTNGKTIAGIVFDSNTKAGATITFYQDTKAFDLVVDFIALVDAPEWYFYEGWLVNNNTSDFFSTGEVTKNPSRGIYQDTFSAVEDLRAYDYYVLTLEPNDNDPAPADHILEWKAKIRSFSESKVKWAGTTTQFKDTNTQTQEPEVKESKNAQQDAIELKLNSLSSQQKSSLKQALPALEERYKNNSSILEILEFIKHILG